MPRSVVAMLGLVLAALSIGYNTAHYPVVWEMVNAAQPVQAAEPAAALQSDKIEQLAPAQPASPPESAAKPIIVKEENSPSEADEKIAADNAPSVKEKSAGEIDPPTARSERQNHLVPVVPVALSNSSGDKGIRRLPPVVQPGANVENRELVASDGGSIPVYPTTGIE